MSDFGPRSSAAYSQRDEDSTAWDSSSGIAGQQQPVAAAAAAAARRTPDSLSEDQPTADINGDGDGWSNVRWSRPGNKSAPGAANDGNNQKPHNQQSTLNISRASTTMTTAASPAPLAPSGSSRNPTTPGGAGGPHDGNVSSSSGQHPPLPSLPPVGDAFWSTVPHPPQWLLAALPYMMQQQQQQGGGGGFPPQMVGPDGQPMMPQQQQHRSASQNSNSRFAQQHHQQMRHPVGPSGYPGAGAFGGYSSQEEEEAGDVRMVHQQQQQQQQRGPHHKSSIVASRQGGYYESAEPERDDEERMYEFRENSPSTRERRNLRHLTADASRHFQEVHRSRTPPAGPPHPNSRHLGGPGGRNSSNGGGGRGLTPEELRRLQREKAERINRNRSNVILEKERMMQRQQATTATNRGGSSSSRGRSPNVGGGRQQLPPRGSSAFPGVAHTMNRSSSARGPSPSNANRSINGRSDIVGKVGPTRRDLVGHKPRLEDALRNGVPPRYTRRSGSAGGNANDTATTATATAHNTSTSATRHHHHHHTESQGSRRGANSRDEQRREVEEALQEASAVLPPQAEYVKGVEDLYHRLRSAYSQVQRDPQSYLQSASLHAATSQGAPNLRTSHGDVNTSSSSPSSRQHLNTSLNLPRGGGTPSAPSFNSSNFSLQNNTATNNNGGDGGLGGVGGGGGGSPNQQTKSLVDQLDKLESQWQQLTSLQERNRGGSQEHTHLNAAGGSGDDTRGVNTSTMSSGYPTTTSAIGDQSYMSTLPRRQPPQGADLASGASGGLGTKEGVMQRLHSAASTAGTANGRVSRQHTGTGGGGGGGELSFSTEQVLERVRNRARQRTQSQQ